MKAIVTLALTAAALVFCSCDRHKWEDTKDPETGEVVKTFVSISDAAREMGISSSNITMVCKGVRSKAGGYCWSYN